MTVILKSNDLYVEKQKSRTNCSALISKKKINYCLVTVVTEISPDV